MYLASRLCIEVFNNFFFSSRRRHTRLVSDWSSDVCSSDLGGPVNVIEYGEGPPLVFVHGLGGSWPNWLEQLPHFGRSRRVIAMDLPGFGHSPMPRKKISIRG